MKRRDSQTEPRADLEQMRLSKYFNKSMYQTPPSSQQVSSASSSSSPSPASPGDEPAPSKRRRVRMAKVLVDSDDEEEKQWAITQAKARAAKERRATALAQALHDGHNDNDNDNDNDSDRTTDSIISEQALLVRPRRQRAGRIQEDDDDDENDKNDDNDAIERMSRPMSYMDTQDDDLQYIQQHTKGMHLASTPLPMSPIALSSDNDDDEEMPSQRRRRKPRTITIDSDDDEAESPQREKGTDKEKKKKNKGKKARRRGSIVGSSEDDDNDDNLSCVVDDDDDVIIYEQETPLDKEKTRQLEKHQLSEEEILDDDIESDGSEGSGGYDDAEQFRHTMMDVAALDDDTKLALMAYAFPDKDVSYLQGVLMDECQGDIVTAMQHDDDTIEFKTVEERQNDVLRMLDAMDDDTKVLRFFNHATLQELMDITTAKSTLVNKLISMRPFTTMDDLERKLRDQKGLSARAIQTYRDMMDGFYRVDRLITQIEDVGAPVLRIIDVWERLGNQISDQSGKKQSRMGENGNDDDATEFDAATKADAMDGYLTSQPATMTTALQLKDYQLTGVNWMLMLFRKGISGILADEMGLGKTAQVISFLARIVELGHTGPHLVVVPTSTVDNWVREFGRFCPALKLLVYQGSIKERMALQDDIDQALDADELNVIITTYAIAAHRIEDRRFFRALGCQSIILDEGHMVKNCNSARYGNLMSIKAPFRLLLTGTPLQNNLQELISLLMFIMPATFEGHETAVRQIFKLRRATKDNDNDSNDNDATEENSHTKSQDQGGSNDDADDKHQVEASAAQLLSQQRIERAKRMMQPFVLRRRKCQVLRHLPKKFQVVDRSPMLPEQQKIYNDIIRDSQARDKEITEKKALIASLRKNGNESDGLLLDTLGSRPISSSYSNIIMHLRKAVDHPLLFRKIYTDSILHDMARDIMKEERYWDADVNYIYEDMTVMSDFELHGLCKQFKSVNKYALCKEEWMDAGKVRRLQTLLQKHKQQGDKVLLFSQFTMMLDILERVMATLGMRYLRLDGNTKQIDRQPLIDQFNDTPNFDVFLLSTKAGGFGINLTAANVVILYDMDFNPHNDRQAEDRAHRVGQVQDVTVYRLIADKSIEETILAMNEVKMRMDQSISNLDGDSQKNEPEGAMNQADVGKLIKSILKQSPLA